MQPSYYFHY